MKNLANSLQNASGKKNAISVKEVKEVAANVAKNEVKSENAKMRFNFQFTFNSKLLSEKSLKALQSVANVSDDELLKSYGDLSKHEALKIAPLEKKHRALKIVIVEVMSDDFKAKYQEIAEGWLECASAEFNAIDAILRNKAEFLKKSLKSEFLFGNKLEKAPKKAEIVAELAKTKAELEALKAQMNSQKATKKA